ARASGVSNVNAATHAWIHILNSFQYIQRRGPQLVFWAVVMDGDADVVFLHKLLNPRQRFERWIASDDDADARSFAVFELRADVVVFVILKIDGSGGVQLDSRGSIISECGGFRLRVHGQMVFGVFRIQRRYVELLHESDHLRAREVAERVAGES